MSSCEKCWVDAGGSVARYNALRKLNACTPEEQAGEMALTCHFCHRRTRHQYTGECMNPECTKEISNDRTTK